MGRCDSGGVRESQLSLSNHGGREDAPNQQITGSRR